MDSIFFPHSWLAEKTLFTIPMWNWVAAALLGASAFLLVLSSLRFAVTRLNKRAGERPANMTKILAELLSATNRMLLGLASVISCARIDLPMAGSGCADKQSTAQTLIGQFDIRPDNQGEIK